MRGACLTPARTPIGPREPRPARASAGRAWPTPLRPVRCRAQQTPARPALTRSLRAAGPRRRLRPWGSLRSGVHSPTRPCAPPVHLSALPRPPPPSAALFSPPAAPPLFHPRNSATSREQNRLLCAGASAPAALPCAEPRPTQLPVPIFTSPQRPRNV